MDAGPRGPTVFEPEMRHGWSLRGLVRLQPGWAPRMSRLTGLLFGSAAIASSLGLAQAAETLAPEPIDYVRICDAFGAGFSYSPGTDSCIRVGGYVKFGTAVGHSDFGSYNRIFPNSAWANFYSEVSLQLTGSSATEYGALTGFLDVRVQTGNDGSFSESLTQATNSAQKTAYIDSAYLRLGPLQAGYYTSLFDFGRGYTDTGAFGSDSTTDHIAVNYAAGGFGLSLSVEDQRDRGTAGSIPLTSHLAVIYVPQGAGLPYDVYADTSWAEGGSDNFPDIVAAATYASGIFSAKLAGAYVNHAIDRSGTGTLADPFTFTGVDGFAVGGSAEFALDRVSPGDRLFFSAAYGDNANSFTGISGNTAVAGLAGFQALGQADVAEGASWSALASYKHVWSPSLWSAVSGGYATYDGAGQWRGDTSLEAWRVVGSTGWSPAKSLDVMLDGQYSSVEGTGAVTDGDAWAVNLWLKRRW